ncbi:MAG: PcfJ domain-containing protein [Myxococcota bacterium]|nr:PcfJ domain-containing protein [Myxococcota bacterium]
MSLSASTGAQRCLASSGKRCFAARREVSVSWRARPGVLWVGLRCRGGASATISLQVAPSASLLVDDPDGQLEGGCWHMVRGVVPRLRYLELFAMATAWVHDHLFRRAPAPGPGACDPGVVRVPRETLRAEASAIMTRVYDLFRGLARLAAELCAPTPRRIALRFLPHLRFRIYQRLLADPTGWLAQLAETEPGVLIFALALVERGGELAVAGEALLAGVQAGQRLPRLLDEALLTWSEVGGRFADVEEHDLPGFSWVELRTASPARCAELRALQRLLIRRAGFRVPTTTLLLPPPPVLVPEDIPSTTLANARWFKVVKSLPRHQEILEPAARRSLRALARLASRQYEAFYAWRSRWGGRRAEELADYLLATGRCPPREADLLGLLDEAQRWHGRFGEDQGPGRRLTLAGAAQIRLPRLGVALPASSELVVRSLDTAQELGEEGARLHHCVATRLNAALAGRCYLFSVLAAGEPLTLELVRQGGQVRPGDLRGVANAAASPAQRRLLEPWLQQVCGTLPDHWLEARELGDDDLPE